jgi:hypothetical protein
VSTDAGWLMASGGSSGDGALTIEADCAQLEPGTHRGRVMVSATGGGSEVIDVRVDVRVHPLSGRNLRIQNALPDDPTRNRLVFVSKDPGISVGAVGSDSDPRCQEHGGGDAGGRLEVESLTSGEHFVADLPCENWRLWGRDPGAGNLPRGYKYMDRRLDAGPCRLVLIKPGRVLSAVCRGGGPSPVDFDLKEGRVHAPVRVSIAAGSLVQCARFGGTVKKDGSDGESLRLSRAPRPDSCLVP